MHVEKEFQKNINHKGSPETRSLKLLGYRLRFFRDINLYGMCFMRFRLRPLLHSPFSTPPAFPACFLDLAEPKRSITGVLRFSSVCQESLALGL